MQSVGNYFSRGMCTFSDSLHPFGGAVDMIVVEQQDGSFRSSPWYVQFGKFQGVLKAKEKIVNVVVNGKEAGFHMYLDNRGGAYFLKECGSDEGECVPSPSTSGDDEADGGVGVKSHRKAQSCDCDSGVFEDDAKPGVEDKKSAKNKNSPYYKKFGFFFGKKSTAKEAGQENADSLQHAEIAAELLETRWTTNANASAFRHGVSPRSPFDKDTKDANMSVDELTQGSSGDSLVSIDVTVKTSHDVVAGGTLECSVTTHEEVMESSMSETRDDLAVFSETLSNITIEDAHRPNVSTDQDKNPIAHNVSSDIGFSSKNMEHTPHESNEVCNDSVNEGGANDDAEENTSTANKDDSVNEVGANDAEENTSTANKDDSVNEVGANDAEENTSTANKDPSEISLDENSEINLNDEGLNKTSTQNIETKATNVVIVESHLQTEVGESQIAAEENTSAVANISESKITKICVLTPSSEQLASLCLKEGQNSVIFNYETEMLGKQQVDARIYLWKWNTHIVVSDVDGTITRSDVLGQVMPLVGRDWSHAGIAHLYSSIKDNGYQFIYLSARAISQAGVTRQFLCNLKQDGKTLPDGPIVLSPNGLFPSFYREVIRRAPQEFKISCLEDIRAVFPPDCNPFYAGFGNRHTDEISYLKVGIPKGKIFTINPKGEVLVSSHIDTKSYHSLHPLVNDMFPISYSVEKEDFNNWNFWRTSPVGIDV